MLAHLQGLFWRPENRRGCEQENEKGEEFGKEGQRKKGRIGGYLGHPGEAGGTGKD